MPTKNLFQTFETKKEHKDEKILPLIEILVEYKDFGMVNAVEVSV